MRAEMKIWPRILQMAGVAFAAMISPVALHAQNCALCYQSVAASPNNFIQALKGGIFVLIVPSLLICAGVTVTAYRKRNISVEEDRSARE